MDITEIRRPATDGVTYRSFSRRGYDRLLHGVYGHWPAVAEDRWTTQRARFLAQVRAVLAVYGHQGVALHGATALQVLGVALPTALEDWNAIHLLIPPKIRRPVRRDVVTHRDSGAGGIWRCPGGIPVGHPVDHWLQLRHATLNQLIEVGDGFLRRKSPLLTLEHIDARLAERAGAPGITNARRARRWLVPDTDSLCETSTRMLLVRAGLPQPTVNLPVYCRSTGMTYHLDMAYDKEKVGVEYDGAVHVGDRIQMEIDADRRRILQDEGWLIITVTAGQLAHGTAVVRSVANALLLRRSMNTAGWI